MSDYACNYGLERLDPDIDRREISYNPGRQATPAKVLTAQNIHKSDRFDVLSHLYYPKNLQLNPAMFASLRLLGALAALAIGTKDVLGQHVQGCPSGDIGVGVSFSVDNSVSAVRG